MSDERNYAEVVPVKDGDVVMLGAIVLKSDYETKQALLEVRSTDDAVLATFWMPYDELKM